MENRRGERADEDREKEKRWRRVRKRILQEREK